MFETCDCGEKPNLEASVDFKCAACSKLIKKIDVRNPLKVAALATVIAYGGSQLIDYAITDNRYPLAVEYAVLDACISSYDSPLSYRTLGSKREICLCALEDTMNEISYVRFKVDEGGFLKSFEENAKSCK